MSRTKILLNVIKDIRNLADSLQELYEVMLKDEVKDSAAKSEEVQETIEATSSSQEVVEVPKTSISLEEVRGALAKKAQEGKTALVRELIAGYGVTKLSEVDEKYYEELMKKVEEI